MAIIRTALEFESEFTRMPNDWVRDGDLSLKARGLLAVLMSHRPGWRISKATLIAGNPEGREAIEGALRELRAAGYLEVAPSRDEKTGRMQGQDWVICVPDRSTGNPSFGAATPKKTKKQEDQENQEVKLDLAIEHADGHKPATAAQMAFLRDCHLLVFREVPRAGDVFEWKQWTRTQAHSAIREYWAEIEHSGDENLGEVRDLFGGELSARALSYIDERLAG